MDQVSKFESSQSYLLAACIANLDKFQAEGVLDYRWVTFPTKLPVLRNVFAEIGIDTYHPDTDAYRNILFVDYESMIPHLTEILGEVESIDELNYLAHLVSDMSEIDYHTFYTFMQTDRMRPKTLQGVINLALPQNIKKYITLQGIRTCEDLSRHLTMRSSSPFIAQITETYGCMEQYAEHLAEWNDAIFTDYGCTMKVKADAQIEQLYTGDRSRIPITYRVMTFHPDLPDQKNRIIRFEAAYSGAERIAESDPPYLASQEKGEQEKSDTELPEPEEPEKKSRLRL